MLPFHDILIIAMESIRTATSNYSRAISPSDTLANHGITTNWHMSLLTDTVSAQLRNRGFTIDWSRLALDPQVTVSLFVQGIAASALPGDSDFGEPSNDDSDTASDYDD